MSPLNLSPWRLVFTGERPFQPRPSDLGYKPTSCPGSRGAATPPGSDLRPGLLGVESPWGLRGTPVAHLPSPTSPPSFPRGPSPPSKAGQTNQRGALHLPHRHRRSGPAAVVSGQLLLLQFYWLEGLLPTLCGFNPLGLEKSLQLKRTHGQTQPEGTGPSVLPPLWPQVSHFLPAVSDHRGAITIPAPPSPHSQGKPSLAALRVLQKEGATSVTGTEGTRTLCCPVATSRVRGAIAPPAPQHLASSCLLSQH